MKSEESALRTPPRLTSDQGANLVEYAMLIALVVVVCLAAVQFFAGRTSSKMSCTASVINSQNGGVAC